MGTWYRWRMIFDFSLGHLIIITKWLWTDGFFFITVIRLSNNFISMKNIFCAQYEMAAWTKTKFTSRSCFWFEKNLNLSFEAMMKMVGEKSPFRIHIQKYIFFLNPVWVMNPTKQCVCVCDALRSCNFIRTAYSVHPNISDEKKKNFSKRMWKDHNSLPMFQYKISFFCASYTHSIYLLINIVTVPTYNEKKEEEKTMSFAHLSWFCKTLKRTCFPLATKSKVIVNRTNIESRTVAYRM